MKAQLEIRKWADKDGRKLGWLSDKIPVAQSSLSRWMKGRIVPSAVYRNRLADITGLDMVRDAANWIKPGDLA